MKKLFLLTLLMLSAFSIVRADNDSPFVSVAPGEQNLYNCAFDAYYYIGDYPTHIENVCYKINFDSNKAYLFNLFSVFDPITEYIEADIIDNNIFVPTGFVYKDLGYALVKVKRFYQDSNDQWVMDNENNPVVFTINENGSISENDPKVMIGLVTFFEEDDWMESAIFDDYFFSPSNIENLNLPDNVTDIKTYRRYNEYTEDETYLNYVIEIARDGNDFYFRGLYDYPDTMDILCWVKGSLEGNNIVIPNNQLIGVDLRGYFCYNANTEVDMNTGEFIIKEVPASFSYDESNNTMTSEDWLLAIQGTEPFMYFPAPQLYSFELVEATPADPEILMFDDDWFDWFGTTTLVFLLPYEDTEGNFIDPELMTFSIFIDNENPYVFEPTEYPNFLTPRQEFSFFENNNYVVNSTSDGYQRHLVDLTTNSFDKIGVQSYYTVNNVTKKSNIVWYDKNSSAVESLTDNKHITNIEYFDLKGNKTDHNYTGIVIRKITYSDGKSESSKLLKLK